MKSRILFFLFGLALGAIVFWLPTVFVGGDGFALPTLLLGPWYLLAIPYIAVFILVFGILTGIYRLFKRSFPISFTDAAWILLGFYLSMTFLFHFVGIAITGGNLTI